MKNPKYVGLAKFYALLINLPITYILLTSYGIIGATLTYLSFTLLGIILMYLISRIHKV